MRASKSASRSVTETNSPSKAKALICMLYRSSVPADCCTSPGIEPPKAPKCSFVTPPGGTEKSRRAVLQTPCEGVPLSAALTYVGGRAQPAPAAEGVASPRRQQGHGVALQLEASHRRPLLERTRKLPNVVSVGSSSTLPRVASVTSSAPPSRNSCLSSSAKAAVSSSTSTVLSAGRRRPPLAGPAPGSAPRSAALQLRSEAL